MHVRYLAQHQELKEHSTNDHRFNSLGGYILFPKFDQRSYLVAANLKNLVQLCEMQDL